MKSDEKPTMKSSNFVLGKVIKLQHALSNNAFGETIHGRKLTMPRYTTRMSTRSYSVNRGAPSKNFERSRKPKMNQTVYTAGFYETNHSSQTKSKSVMNRTHVPAENPSLNIKKAKNFEMFYPRSSSNGRETANTAYGKKVIVSLNDQ